MNFINMKNLSFSIKISQLIATVFLFCFTFIIPVYLYETKKIPFIKTSENPETVVKNILGATSALESSYINIIDVFPMEFVLAAIVLSISILTFVLFLLLRKNPSY